MLILTILLSLALAALFTLLPARIHHRRPVRADLYAGAGVSALVWLWAVCVWSKPGLSVGFDAFRLAAILIMQAIACGVVCGFRLRGTLPRKLRTPAAVGLLLAASLGIELFVCNLNWLATHSYTPVDLRPYLVNDADPAAPLTLWELPKGRALPLPPAPPAEFVPDKAPSMLPVSRLVFAESDAEADEFYSAACTALAHGVGTCRALLHNGRPVCTVGCYEQSDTESYMAAGVTDPAWQGRGLARYLIVGLANELTAERAVRFACFPALCGFYAQLGFLQIGKIQHYTTDWNTT